jgi:hypothetical protein
VGFDLASLQDKKICFSYSQGYYNLVGKSKYITEKLNNPAKCNNLAEIILQKS